MGKFINPFTDYGFKKIFGQEVSKELLIEFLNDLLKGERVITDLTFLNNEQLPDYPGDRIAIYDIYCATDTGEKIIVEMQNRSQVHFKERALYYLSHAIVRQGVKGESWKFDIKAVYGVFFINFLLDENQKLRTPPLFSKSEEECETDFERWIFVLNNMETLNRMPFKAQKAVFKKLEEIVDVHSLSEEDRVRYENSVNAYRDYLATIDYAAKKGIEEGFEEGVQKGEQKKALEIARNLKSMGMTPEQIMNITHLSLAEIDSL